MTDRPEPVVVVVEDAPDAMQILVELLEHHGFRAVRAWNGAEALLAIDAHQPDLVLLDLSLPVLDGWGVARALRAEAGTRAIPILALTAHATLPEIDRAREVGCDSVFLKPAPHDLLLLEMRRLIRRRGRRARADRSGVVARASEPPARRTGRP